MLILAYAKVPQRCTFSDLNKLNPRCAKFIVFTLYSVQLFKQLGFMSVALVIKRKCMQKRVCMCVTKFLITDALVWRLLTVSRSHSNIYIQSHSRQHVLTNGDLFVFTAFIYSSEFCWVSELLHLHETYRCGSTKKRQSNVLDGGGGKKANLECAAKIMV